MNSNNHFSPAALIGNDFDLLVTKQGDLTNVFIIRQDVANNNWHINDHYAVRTSRGNRQASIADCSRTLQDLYHSTSTTMRLPLFLEDYLVVCACVFGAIVVVVVAHERQQKDSNPLICCIR